MNHPDQPDYAAAVEAALGRLDLDTKTRLLAGQDLWSLPAVPEIGLESVVMSDGPVGVRGPEFDPDDPALTLPSPTALAATWSPELARTAGRALAQEAHRKGVHVLLAPTVNLHRSPLGGRHFESYAEDALLTARIGAGYVTGLQESGVAATVKHFVANDAETERFTVDNQVGARALRELYLAPFEEIIATARPWALMSAYNSVNGSTMTEHRPLQIGVLRKEWGFDGVVVSDWLAARDTVRAIEGGLDIAMPGPFTVFGPALAAAVRDGRVAESTVDTAVRHVLLLAARLGLLKGAPPVVGQDDRPAPVDGEAVAREIATRSIVMLENRDRTLPLDASSTPRIVLIGRAARDARILGGGSATVFPAHVVSPLDGLRAALPDDVALDYALGADPDNELSIAAEEFTLRAVLRDAHGSVLAECPLPVGNLRWTADALPDGVDFEALDSVEVTGTFTPRDSGTHHFGTRGIGDFRLTVDGSVVYEGVDDPEATEPMDAVLIGRCVPRRTADLEAGRPVTVSLLNRTPKGAIGTLRGVAFSLAHRAPERDGDQLIEEAVAAASAADVAVVVVATTEHVESEGFDRATLRLPGRQDELVARVAAANPRTVVIVNSGAPVEMPWREDVAAVLLSWFPGQEGGAALADVLLGHAEPGGRLPTTWPARLTDAPVTQVTPTAGVLRYDEGVFIGYRAWQRHATAPAYPFGHGLGYTDWTYEHIEITDTTTARIRLRNTGDRTGREVVQLYVAPTRPDTAERPERCLAGFAAVTAEPGEAATAEIPLPERAFILWDENTGGWTTIPGEYQVLAGHSVADTRLSAVIAVPAKDA
ncbi:glycoside hydrolase family 3 protein [Streptomyces sp. NBC_00063]|uniref:beta-glucosidase n=1 Tax=Streptomyces sp. NBC_00063 TaxID=2975638 RepID=UPI00224F709D|nr:glycoside hydrolase family 3 C-terminal domain-containing protein [Streptomyces sp. NBC_00063]MCX5441898.1 glycoside hydrolase family 3 C-terminal domain-containing protein [Streptomyces sp. NBC_00063]